MSFRLPHLKWTSQVSEIKYETHSQLYYFPDETLATATNGNETATNDASVQTNKCSSGELCCIIKKLLEHFHTYSQYYSQ